MAKGKQKPPPSPLHLRIFLASPGDVAEERAIAREVIERLPYDPLLRGRITVDLVAWDGPGGAPMEATMTPQEAIKRGLSRPSECEIAVVIFWARMGTPLPTDWESKPDGSAYHSGTEWEYLDALRAAERTGDPKILVYRRTEEPVFRPSDSAFMEKYQQWQAVEAFFAEFRNADGSFKGGYNGYETPAELGNLLEDHLKALIKDRLGDETGAGRGDGDRASESAAMHAEVHGGGVVAQGKGAVAAGEGGVAIGKDVKGSVILTGNNARVTQHIHGEAGQDRTDAESLERSYLSRLLEQAGYLSLAGLDPALARDKDARLRLEAVYTALLTTTIGLEKSEERLRRGPRLSALEMLDRERRLVLLGDPGSGKSTLVNFVALCLAGQRLKNEHLNLGLLTHPLPDGGGNDQEDSQPWHHHALLPVRVILRDFAARGLPPIGEQATGDDLWRFIEQSLGETLSEYRPLLKRHLLETGGLIMLDGLDEVPEAEHRRVQVKQAVEGFAQSFPACRVLLTSRTYAYQNQNQDWRLPGFAETTLAPLHNGQIRRFVRRWYEHAAALGRFETDDATGRAALLESAIFDRPQLRELAERPLLLTLMASLHAWRGGSLPEQRERLYADTVDLLLEFWEGRRVVYGPDRQPKVEQPSLAEYLKVGKDQVREVLEDLAFHAHAGQPDLEGTADIPEGELLSGLLALSARRPEEPANTALLIHYLRDRAGILAARGVGVYTFPHRSFQEYLTACRLTGETLPDEAATLARQDPDRWREVVLLAAAKAARGVRSSVWTLADCLCFREPDDSERSEADPWGARLAAETLIESADLAKVGEANRAKLARVRRWLVHLLRADSFPAHERALIGHHLALLGDPRPEVIDVDAMQFCYVPPGPFRMGSGDEDDMASDDERPLHDQDLDYGYWLARYPVTVAQFRAYVEKSGCQPEDADALGDDPNTPVRLVSWHEALAFCDWLTERWREKALLPEGYRVTLPSEREWEKAARGGLEIPAGPLIARVGEDVPDNRAVANPDPSRRYPWGDEPDPERANYANSNVSDSSAVGAFPGGVTPHGCEDMSGNLWEWTRSLWGEDWQEPTYKYPYDPQDGRESIEAPDFVRRVLRGGAFDDTDNLVRCAYRYLNDPDSRYSRLGFRVVLSPFL